MGPLPGVPVVGASWSRCSARPSGPVLGRRNAGSLCDCVPRGKRSTVSVRSVGGLRLGPAGRALRRALGARGAGRGTAAAVQTHDTARPRPLPNALPRPHRCTAPVSAQPSARPAAPARLALTLTPAGAPRPLPAVPRPIQPGRGLPAAPRRGIGRGRPPGIAAVRGTPGRDVLAPARFPRGGRACVFLAPLRRARTAAARPDSARALTVEPAGHCARLRLLAACPAAIPSLTLRPSSLERSSAASPAAERGEPAALAPLVADPEDGATRGATTPRKLPGQRADRAARTAGEPAERAPASGELERRAADCTGSSAAEPPQPPAGAAAADRYQHQRPQMATGARCGYIIRVIGKRAVGSRRCTPDTLDALPITGLCKPKGRRTRAKGTVAQGRGHTRTRPGAAPAVLRGRDTAGSRRD